MSLCLSLKSDFVCASLCALLLTENLKCKPSDTTNRKSVDVSCSITSAGNWAPVVICRQFDENGITVLEGNRTETFSDKYLVKSVWNFSCKKKVLNIECLAKFDQSDIPKEASARNIPENDIYIWRYGEN